MSAKLIVNLENESYEMPCASVITIGRSKNSDVVLADPSVSRNHSIIRQTDNNQYFYIDGGSSNGSYINGKRVQSSMQLRNGDVIDIGKYSIQFSQNLIEAPIPIEQDETVQISEVNIKQITILVSDIRGFTSLTEAVPIKTLTKVMSDWSGAVRRDVIQRGGILEKFIGDCVYARWETKDNPLESILTALECAKELRNICDQINDKYWDLQHPLRIGVGINTGYAAVDVGKDSIALGDTVNLAFRLESATKDLGKDIIMSFESAQYLPQIMWDNRQQSIQVKGKKDSVNICGYTFKELDEFLFNLHSSV